MCVYVRPPIARAQVEPLSPADTSTAAAALLRDAGVAAEWKEQGQEGQEQGKEGQEESAAARQDAASGAAGSCAEVLVKVRPSQSGGVYPEAKTAEASHTVFRTDCGNL